MEAKLLAVLSAQVPVSVSKLCAELGISRQTFYKYRRRFVVEGPAGLVERSRRPHRSPQLIDAVLEDEILRLRKTRESDNGALAIHYQLVRQGRRHVPSVATVHRVLVRRGQVVPQPQKAPPSKGIRFEYPAPNGAWQIDATQWALVDGQQVWIMDVLDDHSRLMIASLACHGPTGAAAWQAFCDGTTRWGLPARVMSDNGRCFTARFLHLGGEADFERDLRALGVQHILSSPGHPQTCGKIERQHQTVKGWLNSQPPARSLPELQHRLDDYLDHYNYQRPHSALVGATPHERWSATPPDGPGPPIELAPNSAIRRVDPDGKLPWNGYVIGIGQTLAGAELLIISRDHQLTIFGPTGLVERRTIDPTRRYQPSGRPPGRPKQPR